MFTLNRKQHKDSGGRGSFTNGIKNRMPRVLKIKLLAQLLD